MKKNKTTLMIAIIAVIAVVALIACVLATGAFKSQESSKEPETNDEIIKEEENTLPKEVPAANTEELKQTVAKVEVEEITKDKIIFNTGVNVKVGEKVAVWIYSEPQFVGYFEVKEVDGQKTIEGLEEKLAELEIEAGEHNIAIANESGETVGYFDVVIEDTGTLQEEAKPIVKEVTETAVIKFNTETRTTANLVAGREQTVQAGVNGQKVITYEVTYDANGNEISRTKISEKITKNAVTQIIEKGTADYSLSTAKITETATGFLCLMTEKAENGCNGDFPLFSTIAIDGQYYAKCLNDNSACLSTGLQTSTKLTKTSEGLTATINGNAYYFDLRAGSGGSNPLTIEKCNEYKLVCAN